jgi:predicted membrane protein
MRVTTMTMRRIWITVMFGIAALAIVGLLVLFVSYWPAPAGLD